MSTSTPWGPSQQSTRLSPGIIWYSTASHGGVHLCPTRNAMIPEAFRAEGGWYEEDTDWNIVAYYFPEAFPKEDRRNVIATLKNWRPDEFERATGQKVKPEESLELRARLFREKHKHDWVVIAAWGSWHATVPTGMVGVCCTRGGVHGVYGKPEPEQYFLVPKSEYDARDRGEFVVDTTQHKPWQPHA